MAKNRVSCVRCAVKFSADTGRIRNLCSACDLELQQMHHAVEYVINGKTTYADYGDASYAYGSGARVTRNPVKPCLRGLPEKGDK